MDWEISEDKDYPGNWHVDAIDFVNEGSCYVTIFSGPDAENRAREYAGWLNSVEKNKPFAKAS
jgi:hypothetical protein